MKIIIAGDLAPIRHFAPMMAADPEAVYGDVLPVLRSADVRLVNLESPLAGQDFIVKSGAAFTGAPEHLAALTAVPFDGVTLANNHTFDTGLEGFRQTIALLDGAGIAHAGAGMTAEEAEAPMILEHGGVRVAVFTMSEGEDQCGASADKPGVAGWDVDGFCRRIAAEKACGKAQAVLAIVHCGLEYYPFPPMYVVDAFRQIAEAGADCVIGHHVHVPQGMAMFGKTPAFFSLGNFVFFQDTTLAYRKMGYLVSLEIGKDGVVKFDRIPYRITDDGVRLMTADEKSDFERLFQRLSQPLCSNDSARSAWEACLAWYGQEGYCQELEKILTMMRQDPPKGAAMLRNRVNCMQHRMHWIDGLTRIADGTIAQAEPDLVTLVKDFFSTQL